MPGAGSADPRAPEAGGVPMKAGTGPGRCGPFVPGGGPDAQAPSAGSRPAEKVAGGRGPPPLGPAGGAGEATFPGGTAAALADALATAARNFAP